MFLRRSDLSSAANYQEQIRRLKKELETADAVIIGAGAVLSAAAGMQAASGAPFTAAYFQSKGDPVTDLHEAMAAEQKARTTYDNILRLADDPDVIAPIRFLRQREVVHYQRFGEGLRLIEEALDDCDPYARNPAFDA